MKIVQSFWTGNQNDFTNPHGWYNYKYNWLSWILSCHQLIKYHEDVELYTDTFGYEILINKLQLPYTKVHVVLDELNHYHKDLWAIAKIRTFQLQTEPFLHVDGDVFVWESLTNKFENANLAVQNLEITSTYYPEKWSQILPNLVFLPTVLKNFKCTTTNLVSNMGIIGGTNLDFFANYTQKSTEFVNKNKAIWHKIKSFNFNIFFEQIFFYEFAKQNNQKVEVLFLETPRSNEYKGMTNFSDIPTKTYLHFLGDFKKDVINCKQMEIYTMNHYPEAYSKLMTLVNHANKNEAELTQLNAAIVGDFIAEFKTALQSNQFNAEHFLLKRDLYNIALPHTFTAYLNQNTNFKLVLLPCFEQKSKIKDQKTTTYIAIKELNTPSRNYNLDQIDQIMLHELSSPIDYKDFMLKIKAYFPAEDAQEFEKLKLFLGLINNRLKHYLTLKIMSIYKV